MNWVIKQYERLVHWDELWGMERGMVVSGTFVVLILVVAGSLSAAGVI